MTAQSRLLRKFIQWGAIIAWETIIASALLILLPKFILLGTFLALPECNAARYISWETIIAIMLLEYVVWKTIMAIVLQKSWFSPPASTLAATAGTSRSCPFRLAARPPPCRPMIIPIGFSRIIMTNVAVLRMTFRRGGNRLRVKHATERMCARQHAQDGQLVIGRILMRWMSGARIVVWEIIIAIVSLTYVLWKTIIEPPEYGLWEIIRAIMSTLPEYTIIAIMLLMYVLWETIIALPEYALWEIFAAIMNALLEYGFWEIIMATALLVSFEWEIIMATALLKSVVRDLCAVFAISHHIPGSSSLRSLPRSLTEPRALLRVGMHAVPVVPSRTRS